jgi:dienelactone hydrolase
MKTLFPALLLFAIFVLTACPSKKKTEPKTEPPIARGSVVFDTTFNSLDGMPVYATVYETTKDKPVIVLCHQAGYNKTEYRETAPMLNEQGFNCMAIDQRSGGKLNETENMTHETALSKGKSTEYLDAEQDILAAVDFAATYFQQPVILLGSSYSASLALKIASENPQIYAVVAFSPGEYFGKELVLREKIGTILVPVFVTSSKSEAKKVTELAAGLNPDILFEQYIPETEGDHGSKVLWKGADGQAAYWDALITFLDGIRPAS